MADTDSVTYGVNYHSVLNDLTYFHVADNQLPQDVMHVLLEGVVPYTIKCMLQSMICSKHYFTLNLLNERISCFEYSRTESRNKPAELKDKVLLSEGNLGQTGGYMPYQMCDLLTNTPSASQTWNLAIYLPLIIGDKIPEGDAEWENYLTLLNILRISMSRTISKDLVGYLKVLMKVYLSSFHECYPTTSITPKQHYLIHLPSQILKYVCKC